MIQVSLKELRAISQGSISRDLDRYPLLFKLIRKISIYLSWILVHTPMSPNSITVSGIITSYLGLVCLLNGQIFSAIIFFIYSVVSDFSDGEVSRYKKLQSKEGTFLDKVHHLHTTVIFFAAILLYQYDQTESVNFLYAAFIILPFSILFPFSVSYGIDVAELTHLNYFLNGKKYSGYKLNKSKLQGSSLEIVEKRSRSKKSAVQFISDLSRYWTFPYVFVVYGATFALDYFLLHNFFELSQLVTLFYAVTFPIWCYLYIWRVLKTRIISKRFDEHFEKLE